MSFGIDPAKLELNLNLDRMDFAEVVAATQDAIAHDRSASRRYREEAKAFDDIAAEADRLARQGSTSSPSVSTAGAKAEPSDTARPDGAGAAAPVIAPVGGRTIRGIVGAGNVHDANSPAAVRAQRRVEERGEGGGPGKRRHGSTEEVRYTLMDTLRDCSMTGNWQRAYRLFEGALEKAYTMVLVPAAPRDEGGPTGRSSSVPPGQERELWESLRKIMAALPPPAAQSDRAAANARRRGMDNVAGVMRWGGGHYVMLLKTLTMTARTEEVERVWEVMKGIGFTRYQMDERTLNSLVSLLRRSGGTDDATQQLVTPLVAAQRTHEVVEREKALKRRLILELEEIARERRLALRGANEHTATVARIAEAMHSQEAEAGGRGAAVEGVSDDGPARNPPPPALHVGDFNGLLRLAQSHEGTRRVLAMMEKLGVPRDATTFASAVAAHRAPHYRVEGATEAEVARANGSGCASMATVGGVAAAEADEHASASPAASGEAQRAYEAYKEKRIASARQWFDACPREARSAALYVEMLYLLRAPHHAASFDALLTECRGNALRTPEQWEAMEARQQGAAESTERVAPALLPPAWTVPPSGALYDLLIRRCRYRHDFEGMWALLEEMRLAGVRGPGRLYQLLLSEAKLHPPASVRRNGDVSRFILDLYEEMRRQNVDVTSVQSTVNLVNAWSDTRRKRRWS